jgi:hypothetical protein
MAHIASAKSALIFGIAVPRRVTIEVAIVGPAVESEILTPGSAESALKRALPRGSSHFGVFTRGRAPCFGLFSYVESINTCP